MIYKMLKITILKKWVLLGRTRLFAILVVSTMFRIYAKIGMIQVIVLLVTVVFICTIDQMSKQDGSYRKISKKLNERDGNALTIQI